ncbi:hypothetical protein PR048_021857 [Dryococelus australis]|uniref:Uncharacterized protein n=1 Tax=Dryococelus australis TaxID=614101 RepID=A0ABQ9GZJ9_9NEOP|nr:hypothetical protein PR048_021857 [Dryococelus australis]
MVFVRAGAAANCPLDTFCACVMADCTFTPWATGEAVRLFASHLGEQVSIPGGVAPGFSHAGMVADDADGRRIFSGSPPPLSFRRCSILTSITLIGSQDLYLPVGRQYPLEPPKIASLTLHCPTHLWVRVEIREAIPISSLHSPSATRTRAGNDAAGSRDLQLETKFLHSKCGPRGVTDPQTGRAVMFRPRVVARLPAIMRIHITGAAFHTLQPPPPPPSSVIRFCCRVGLLITSPLASSQLPTSDVCRGNTTLDHQLRPR